MNFLAKNVLMFYLMKFRTFLTVHVCKTVARENWEKTIFERDITNCILFAERFLGVFRKILAFVISIRDLLYKFRVNEVFSLLQINVKYTSNRKIFLFVCLSKSTAICISVALIYKLFLLICLNKLI